MAARSHAINFHPGMDGKDLARAAAVRDITETDPASLGRAIGARRMAEAFDVIVGGPPCQAYARIGRAKLREIAAHPDAYKLDPRANLYLRYLEYVRKLKPLALLIENVPDIMNYGGRNVAEEICETLAGMGYLARYTLLNAARYGVPQMRDRVFILAVHQRLGVVPEFPAPTHWINLPSGYAGLRKVALRRIDLLAHRYFIAERAGQPDLPPAITAEEALRDLPPITAHLHGLMRRGARRFTTTVPYGPLPPSAFGCEMRRWPGFAAADGIADHVIRLLTRDPLIFRHMPEGAEYPAAVRIAEALYARRLARVRRATEDGIVELDRAAKLRRMVPPYPVGTFPNRWWKLRRDQPSRTLMAHLGKDSYSHIHYDGRQARTISVREAARLQSFPDGFRFEGAMNAAFRQIGNAVPPLLAYQLAETIGVLLRGNVRLA